MDNPRRHPDSPLSRAARNLLFPPRCVGCDSLLPPFAPKDTVFCPFCRTEWEAAVAEADEAAAADAARGIVYLTFYRPSKTDGIPERLIYHIKHRGERRTLDFVAERLAPRIRKAVTSTPARKPAAEDRPLLFTYPPRRRVAVSEDGFDQAERLSKAFAKICHGEHATLIRRTRRRAREQKRLTAEERASNAARAYTLEDKAAPLIRDRTVVLCDDLRTTGATLEACAGLLVGAGARSVILVTVAATVGKKP